MPKLGQLGAPVGGSLFGGPPVQTLDVKDQGNGTIQLLVTDTAIQDKVRHAVDQSIEVLRRRVDALGTTEPNIQRQGDDRILVEVPGLQNPEKLKEILVTTAKLAFRLVAQPGEDPNDYEMLDQTDEPGKLPVEKQVMVQGEDLTDAQPGFDQRTGEPIVEFRFNIRGGERFGEVTSANVGRPFAIVLDTLFKHPMPVVDGAAADPASIQTGPRDPSSAGAGDAITWQPLRIEMSADGKLSVRWKNALLVDGLATGFTPRPGRWVLGARAGGANQNQHIDNLAITQEGMPDDQPFLVHTSKSANGITLRVRHAAATRFNSGNTTLQIDDQYFLPQTKSGIIVMNL